MPGRSVVGVRRGWVPRTLPLRLLLLAFLHAVIDSLAVTVTAQTDSTPIVESGLLLPGQLKIFDPSVFADQLTQAQAEASSVLNVTVIGQLCGVSAYKTPPQDGAGCTLTDENGFQAGLALFCGSFNSTVEFGSNLQKVPSSEYLGGVQTVILGQEGGLYQTDDASGSGLTCVVQSLSYNEGPVWYELQAGVEAGVNLVTDQIQAMETVYDACCASQGGCTGWTRSTTNATNTTNVDGGNARRKVLQEAPTPAPAPDVTVPGPEAAPNVPIAPAPAPEVPVPAPGNATAGGFNFCQFSGSECDAIGYLTTLDLSGMGLQCDVEQLLNALGGLSTLQKLSLSHNVGLTGSVDALFTVLADTRGNNLTNSTLTDVLVSDTGITGPLGGAANGTDVCALGLGQLAFEGTGVSGPLDACLFDNTSKIQVLLGSNSTEMGALPDTFGSAPSLRSLQLSGAGLTGSVASLPTFLGEFDVSNNTLTGLLPTLGQNLTMFDASNNKFNGSVPDSFANHPVLRSVDLLQNNLSGLPDVWVNTTNSVQISSVLQSLRLSENSLDTNFPVGLASYVNLTYLGLSNTSTKGGLPELSSGGFPSLTHLDIDRNSVTGTVPDSWQNTTLFSKDSDAKRVGNFSTNSMSGELPIWLGNMPQGTYYDFSGNDFSNGCQPQFAALNTCVGESQASSPAPEPAPAPKDEPPAESVDEPSGGNSAVLAVFITIVGVVMLSIAAYYGWKWHQAKKQQGTFQRYMDGGQSMVQMVSNQTYNPYNPSLV